MYVVNLVNWNILVAKGKESKCDFLISGELKENSLNLFRCSGFSFNNVFKFEIVDSNTKEGW